MADEDGEKSEEPSPHKMGEAREKGDVAKSRDLENFFLFLASVMSLYFFSRQLFSSIAGLFYRFFDFNSIKLDTTKDYVSLLIQILADVLYILAPLFGTVMVFGVAGYLTQFGFLFTTDKITPDLSKMDPISGFKRMFSKESVVELIKSTIKIVIISAIFYLTFKGETDKLMEIGSYTIPEIFVYFMKLLMEICVVMLIFMLALGVVDFAYQKWSYLQKMRMSPRELKEEIKQKEGDPQIKARIRQIGRDRLRKRMMEKVPKADVVVTNPTHVAVALQYQRGLMRAPVVVAKGAGYIALRIKEIAAEAGVPILERKQLARFLYRNVEINEAIPESLYTAVAEVLAYVYRIKKRFQQWKRAEA